MRAWWQEIAGLVLPADCAGCGRPRSALCDRCRAALCRRPARRVRPVPAPPGLPPVYAVVVYGDEARSVLLAHKERGALGLVRPLGEALATAVRAVPGVPGAGGAQAMAVADGGPPLLVPMPSSRRAVAARGHDPARRIALAAAGALRRRGQGARVAAVLRQRRAVADQSGLRARQRRENLAGALEVVPGAERLLAGGAVVLVDDLMTTGASLAEAARAVRATGRRVAGAAVVAAPLRSFEGIPRQPELSGQERRRTW